MMKQLDITPNLRRMGNYLKKRREEQGLSQETAGKTAGISPAAVYRIELGGQYSAAILDR